MNISKLIIIFSAALICVSCDSNGNVTSGGQQAVDQFLQAPAAAPAPVVAIVERFSPIVDDYGATCQRENSTMCGGWGVALVAAEGHLKACGPGTAVGQWVQDFEWVPC
jgi:hypothetical protein